MITKKEAIDKCMDGLRRWREAHPFESCDIALNYERIIEDAFDWVESENAKKPTVEKCVSILREHAAAMGAEVDLKFVFVSGARQKEEL